MHKYFPDWYRAAGLDPTADTLEKRWQAVEGFSKKIKLQNALELVRIFYNRPTVGADFSDRYSATFQAADPTFSTRDNAVELRVLSGATIAHIIETTRTTLTDAVALAMLCGFCRGLRQKILNSEIVQSARNYLANESVRERDVGPSFEVKTPDTDLDELLNTLTEASTGSSLTSIQEPLRPPFEKLAEAISALASSVNKVAGQFANAIDVHREESDILWWIFGEHSRDLKKRMSELSLPFAALVSGKELADLIRVIPGPLSSEAFLDKVLSLVGDRGSNSTSIKDAVNAASNDWSKNLIEGRLASGVEDLCAIHVAIQKSLESDGSTGWPTLFDKSMGLKSRTTMSPIDMAMQICDERMLMKAVGVVNAG